MPDDLHLRKPAHWHLAADINAAVNVRCVRLAPAHKIMSLHLARVLVRFAEIFESLKLIHKIITELPQGNLRSELRSEPNKYGFGWIEGWRGDVLVALETGTDGKVRRCHCHDPSWQNWPALEHAAIDNIVPDFPLINKSFNQSYSGNDL